MPDARRKRHLTRRDLLKGAAALVLGPWLTACAGTSPAPQPEATAAPGRARGKTLNIAHRGARSLAPENTLAAARKALALGADMWELDVAMAAGGELFLVHDDTLERTSNVAEVFPDRWPWANHTFTLAEIRSLDFGSWFVEQDPFGQIAAGQVTAEEQARYRGEAAPTLREALVYTRENGWRVNVELKDLSGAPGDATVVEQTVALIVELGMAESVLISSFNHSYLARVKAAEPRIATGALVSNADPDPAALLRRLGAQAYNPRVTAIRAEDIAGLREEGFDVFVWTVNDEETMRRLVVAQASGIFTDFPQRLKPIVGG
jgi:glycerophosphoryl diester phosphodiesterase